MPNLTVVCGECGALCSKVKGDRIYPHRPDLYKLSFYLCPQCGAYCGVSTDFSNPRSPAGPVTRKNRVWAHKAFDKLWQSGQMSRTQAYQWLSSVLGIPAHRCHIGMMDSKMALRVVELSLDKTMKSRDKG